MSGTDPAPVLDALRAALAGEVLAPGDPGYDEARRVWNGVIDRHPAVVARCDGTADVVEALAVARHHGIELSVRGGGHQVAGSAVCDGGLVIDLTAMDGVHVDPDARTARVQAGARWGDLDRATQLFGLATTGGEISRTGVAGLTLGGGMGVLQRAFGLACDNVASFEVVTADGVVRTASRDEHPDLWWACRGAGRGLGVVTSIEFDLHPLGPEVAMAWVVYPLEEASSVATAFGDLAGASPETVSPQLLIWAVPPDPELPEELHGRDVIMALGVFAGEPAEAEPVLGPFAQLGDPLADLGGTASYAELQSSMDDLFPDGGRYYFKSQFVDALEEPVIEGVVRAGQRRPNPTTLIAVRTLGGAIDRVDPASSAYPHRGAAFNVSYDACWSDPAQDAGAVAWAREAFAALAPHATGGVYTNFAGFDDEPDVAVSDRLGSSERLAQVRATYDPDGLFAPAAARP